jgi:SAM-dependent methyltransferase
MLNGFRRDIRRRASAFVTTRLTRAAEVLSKTWAPPPTDPDLEIKYEGELAYWRRRFEAEGGVLQNSWYESHLLALANRPREEILADRIVADFGCGPRGSLVWAKEARARIGIDALVDAYAPLGLKDHDMVYVRSTESSIPLPPGYVDTMFTFNALDHVADLPAMCRELKRVIAPGGWLFGSFNLYEPPTPQEPLTLTPELLDRELLGSFEVVERRIRPKGDKEKGVYHYFFSDDPAPDSEVKIMWISARKPAALG